MIRKIIYGPPNYFVERFCAEDRRAFGFWVLVAAIVTAPIFGNAVLYVSVLSVLALVPNYTTETPTEVEGE